MEQRLNENSTTHNAHTIIITVQDSRYDANDMRLASPPVATFGSTALWD